MRKFYFLTLAILCAFLAQAATVNVYVKKTTELSKMTLALYWWGLPSNNPSWPGEKFTESYTDENGVEFWKKTVNIGNATSWNIIINNNNNGKQTVDMKGPTTDTFYEVTLGGSKGFNYKDITPSDDRTGIYLKGNVTSWDENYSGYEFKKTATDKVYELAGVKLQGFFKIADASWNEYNIGASGEAATQITVGEAVALTNGNNSQNLYLDGTYNCSRITLDLRGENPLVTITGEKTNSGVYLKGEVNGWSDSKDWEFTDLGAGKYTLEKAMTASEGSFKVTAYDKWFGLPGESEPIAIAINEKVTLVDGRNMILPGDCTASKFELNIDAAGEASLQITADNVISYPNCLYVVGNLPGQDWNPAYTGAPLYMTNTEGVYSGIVTIADTGEGNGYFSIITKPGEWDVVNSGTRYGAATIDEVLTPGTAATVKSEGGETKSWMIAAGNYEVVVNLAEMSIVATVTDKKPSLPDIYLRGTINDWEALDEYKFIETETEGIYELKNVKIYGSFKIADANWAVVNIGLAGGGFIKINQPNYLINGGDSKDMAFAGTYQCDLIKLDMTGDNPVLTVIGTATGSGIFLSSAKNNWAKDEDLSEWEFEDFGSGYYTLENNYQSNSGEFYINIHGINYGVEGSETTTLEYDETYTLVANAQKLALPAETGVEFFELNILDDEITLTVYEGEYSSIETTIADSKAPVEYFNLQGVKVNADKLNNGIYIKKQGSRTSKVLVK